MFKSFKKKLSGNKKGFTLVELMIVIAIIGILMVTLLPKMQGAKDSARLSGVEANMRAVASQVEMIINDYDTDATLGAALATALGTNIKNPFNDSMTVQNAWVITADPAATSAVVIATETINAAMTDRSDADDLFLAPDGSVNNKANLAGGVVVAIYREGTSGRLEASIYGYKPDGTDQGEGDPFVVAKKVIRVYK